METVPLASSVQLHSNISAKPEIQAGSLESHRTLTINPIIRNYMDEILAKSLRMVSQTGAFRATLYFNNNTTAVDTNVDMLCAVLATRSCVVMTVAALCKRSESR